MSDIIPRCPDCKIAFRDLPEDAEYEILSRATPNTMVPWAFIYCSIIMRVSNIAWPMPLSCRATRAFRSI